MNTVQRNVLDHPFLWSGHSMCHDHVLLLVLFVYCGLWCVDKKFRHPMLIHAYEQDVLMCIINRTHDHEWGVPDEVFLV